VKASLDCIPCFARQALDAARFVTDDSAIHEQVLRKMLHSASTMNMQQSPPAFAQQIHRQLRLLTSVSDPYRAVKDRFNAMAMAMLPGLIQQVEQADDPLEMALRLAIAGNVIDLGAHPGMTETDARQAIASAMNEPFCGDIDAFRDTVAKSKDILYLADNAGEIVFDRLLIEHLPSERITLAVRGGPVLNDATMTDARTVGLCDIVEVIDNGSDAPGTILTDCSDDFRARFAAADLVIAKGQGSFETLSDEDRALYFLFKVKCPLIGNCVGIPTGTHVAMRGHDLRSQARSTP